MIYRKRKLGNENTKDLSSLKMVTERSVDCERPKSGMSHFLKMGERYYMLANKDSSVNVSYWLLM